MQAPADFKAKMLPPDGLKQPLILVGASVRAAAQSANQAGFSVIGIDLFADTDTLDACVQHHRLGRLSDLDDFCRTVPPTAVMQVGGLRDQSAIMNCLTGKHRLMGPATELREKLKDPSFLFLLAEQCGLRFPTTVQTDPPNVDRCDNRATHWRHSSRESLRTLEKNPHDSGGLGVRWAADRHPVGPAGEDKPAGEDQAGSVGKDRQPVRYQQQWIAGRSYGASFLGDGVSARLLGVCRSASTRRDGLPFVYAGSRGLIRLSDSTLASLAKLGCELTQLGLCGLFNADLIVDRSGVAWLLEVNPRWSGSSELIERCMRDQGLVGQHTSLLGLAFQGCSEPLGSLQDWFIASEIKASRAAPPDTYIKRIVYSRHEMRFEPDRLRRAIDALDEDRLQIELCDLPPSGSLIGRGEPILTLITSIPQSKAEQHKGTGMRLRRYIAAVQRAGT